MKKIKKILIANRGEIALRIQHTAKQLNIATVAIFTDDDKNAAFVAKADEAVLLQGNTLAETYLNIEKIINIAQKLQVDAIHPGYGFLSENEKFIDACSLAGIKFIGPPKTAVHAMGNKIEARANAVLAGVPVTPGITGSPKELAEKFHEIGFPILIKAAAGGGGKGMKVVNHETEIAAAIESTAREAKNYFGDDTIYMEKYIAEPRHIEVQILGDEHGNVVHLFERECSIQRRHQKIIEEAPSITLSEETRNRICMAAVNLAASIGYYSAGTMEFLLDANHQFYFLEMNTRIQVEHPITEMITGIDIVAQQIAIAEGNTLPFSQDEITKKGHAIECRIYAENPEKNFLPSPGTISFYQESKKDKNVRIDGMQLQHGSIISGEFDPMIAKLIVSGNDRNEALAIMKNALEQYVITGIETNLEFLNGFIHSTVFINNTFSTKYIDENLQDLLIDIKNKKSEIKIETLLAAGLAHYMQPHSHPKNTWEQIGFWQFIPNIPIEINHEIYQIEIKENNYPDITFEWNNTTHPLKIKKENENHFNIDVNGKDFKVIAVSDSTNGCQLYINGFHFSLKRCDILDENEVYHSKSENTNNSGKITAPMPGKVIKINVENGQQVKKGEVLLIVEAMKMENNILSPMDAVVSAVHTQEQNKVGTSDVLITLIKE